MREMGVRELKQTLSRTLRSIARGETVRVTAHGRPLADIIPVEGTSRDDRLRQLVAEGRLVAPTQARPQRAPRLIKGRGSASAVVLAERDDQR